MARPLQKKKNKSSLSRVRQKSKSKRINIKANSIVAANWDKNATLTQNYRRLGLSTKLNAVSGGTEASYSETGSRKAAEPDALVVGSSTQKAVGLETVQVVRDAAGAITRVVRRSQENMLDDLDQDNELETQKSGNVVRQLEESCLLEKRKRPRQQSEREVEWIERLVSRHGDNLQAMMRDRQLNPMQQSTGQLRRRIAAWQGH